MPQLPPSEPAAAPAYKAKPGRARSVPSAQPFQMAVFFSLLYFFGLIATATALVCFIIKPGLLAASYLAAGLVFSGITWLISFFKRRGVRCPLCKGTPLIESGAIPHQRARRLRPFNYGTSAVLSILASQKFRCMYCGSDYDLLKPKNRQDDPGEL